MLYNGCVNHNNCNNTGGCATTPPVGGCATDSCNIGGNWISCIINLVVIIVVLQFLSQILCNLSCDNNCCCC